MKKHIIDVQELLTFVGSEKMLYARDSRDAKALYITLDGNYVVEHKDDEIYRGDQPAEAVSKYNSI